MNQDVIIKSKIVTVAYTAAKAILTVKEDLRRDKKITQLYPLINLYSPVILAIEVTTNT